MSRGARRDAPAAPRRDVPAAARRDAPPLFQAYARLTTESLNPRSARLDRMTTGRILRLMNDEDTQVAPAVRRVLPGIAALVDRVEGAFRTGGRLFYVGAGTSGRLGVLDAAECPPTFGTPPAMVQGVIAGGMRALVRSIEGAEDDEGAGGRAMARHRVGARDVVLGIAASRMTPYVHGALEAAGARGATTALLTCNPEGDGDGRALRGGGDGRARGASARGSAAADGLRVDIEICPVVGPEVVMGSTRLKAGTATKMVLNMITTASMVRIGKVYRNLMVDLQRRSRKLDERARRVVMLAAEVDYDRAGVLLSRARGEVKTAVVMARAGVGAPRARVLLARSGGHVWRVLGERA